MTAVGHLAKHGYVTLLETSSGEQAILLVPDIINNLAASIVLEARRNRLGAFSDEARLAAGSYPLPELGPFSKNEQATLLDAAVVLFLRHNLCFRKSISDNTYIIFPSLISQDASGSRECRTLSTTYSITLQGRSRRFTPRWWYSSDILVRSVGRISGEIRLSTRSGPGSCAGSARSKAKRVRLNLSCITAGRRQRMPAACSVCFSNGFSMSRTRTSCDIILSTVISAATCKIAMRSSSASGKERQ